MKHMETVRLTASQALVRFLENQYVSYIDMDGNEVEHKFVKGIFMLPGHGNVVGFANGVEQELKDMVVYQGKNEQGMALAAIGYAKQMRRKQIFACTSSVGPGACNIVTRGPRQRAPPCRYRYRKQHPGSDSAGRYLRFPSA